MFGDALQGTNRYQIKTIAEVCDKICDGEHATVKRVKNGKLFISSRNIKTNHRILLDTVSYITDESFEKIRRRFDPESGDILLTCAGSIGNSAVVPEMEPFVADRGLTMLRPNIALVMPEYLHMCITTEFIQEQMRRSIHATALAHLYLNKIKSLRLIVAPLECQKEFISQLRQVDKSKYYNEKSREQICQTLNFFKRKNNIISLQLPQ